MPGTDDHAASRLPGRPRRAPWPAWLWLLLGVVSSLIGLLPWLLTGARLPLQNLWAVETAPDRMPRALLPFSQYALILIIAVLVTGASVAGLGARMLRTRLPRHGVLAAGVGVFLVQTVSVGQATAVTHAGLAERTASALYLAALVAVAVLALLVGVVAFALIAVGPPGGAVLGMSIGALALGPWLSGLAFPFGQVQTGPVDPVLGLALRFVPPVLVGSAIGWAGLRSVGRVVAAIAGLLLVWVVPAITTGVSSAAGSRVLARHPTEMASYAAEVVVSALGTPELVLPPLGVVVVVAAVVIMIRAR